MEFTHNILHHQGNIMPSVKYIIELGNADRKTLEDIVSKGQPPEKNNPQS